MDDRAHVGIEHATDFVHLFEQELRIAIPEILRENEIVAAQPFAKASPVKTSLPAYDTC